MAVPAFYAEYLPNIKSVTISLSNVVTGSSFGLDSSRTRFRIIPPQAEPATIPLPAKCHASGPSGMRISQDPKTEQTVVRVSAEPLSVSSDGNTGAEEDAIPPWSASQLHSQVKVCCRLCRGTVVERGDISTWKDLPSEGWAEMMDLWHCHKPDEHDHGGGVDSKGYAADSKLVAREGVGLVDALGFLVKEGNCVNLKIEPSIPIESTTLANDSSTEVSLQKQSQQEVSCKSCSALLGFLDEQTEGLKLLKPFLALSFRSTPSLSAKIPTQERSGAASEGLASTSPEELAAEELTKAKASSIPHTSTAVVIHAPPRASTVEESSLQTFTTEKWLVAYLLSLIESTGVRKFTVKGVDEDHEDGEIWIFSTSLTYTSSAPTSATASPSTLPASLSSTADSTTSRTVPIQAMKVLFKTSISSQRERHRDGESLSKANLMVEELRLPLRLEKQLWKCLKESNGILPLSAKRFLDWHVGLLMKF